MIDRRTVHGGAAAATLLGVAGAGTASAEVPPAVGPFPPGVLRPAPARCPEPAALLTAEQRFAPYLAILPGVVNDVGTDPATLGMVLCEPAPVEPVLPGQCPAEPARRGGSLPEYSITERSKAATGSGLGYVAKTPANLRQVNALPARPR
ncbi:hypothetical protein SAMN05421837_103103 [Amycolatopsis pretoriensis]|uniref:Secreted protein n=1 Tax=Amycolatopsis pretoriensis TaxID=218821 RepID=A0A1H5QJ63_9PSEU|nr:hypothetical protein SAMN05421837_103103 [Amycolatopsis pretoriensis]